MNDLAAFARLIQAIDPWRAHLVLVGGWAHRLHRFHPLATALGYTPLITKDTDLAFGNEAPLDGDIGAALLKSGFAEELAGEHTPPVTHYALGEDDAGFYAEFLTPLHGSGTKRNGAPDATVSRAGITAQKLRHLDILLVEPWIVKVGPEQGIPLLKSTDVLVANPTAFIVQKLLIQKDRSPAKRAQDVLYIHDTLELFGAALPDLQSLWTENIRPTLSARAARGVTSAASDTFKAVTDIIRDAARIPADRRLSPERLQAASHAAMMQILATLRNLPDSR